MSNNSRIQIPITNKVRKALEQKAEEEGFSSANDLMRFLMHKFLSGDFQLTIITNSPKQHLALESEANIAKSLQELQDGDYDVIDFSKNPKAAIDFYSKSNKCT